MAQKYTRNELAARLQVSVTERSPIVMTGAADEHSALSAEVQRADLMVVYNSGRFRTDVLPSVTGLMPYGNANQIVLELALPVISAVKEIPILAGLCGTDPTWEMPQLLRKIREVGFSGVINYPTVALFDGRVRQDFERANLGFGREIEMIAIARELELYTACYVGTPDESRRATEAGADLVVSHVGFANAWTMERDDALAAITDAIQEINDVAHTVNSQVIMLASLGPVAEPEDVAYVLQNTSSQGYVCERYIYRLPVQVRKATAWPIN